MTREELIKAQEELKQIVASGKLMELAKVIGEPVDPLRPYPKVVETLCETSDAEPGDDLFVFDVEEDVREVYFIDNSGTVTSKQVTPATPSQISFSNILTPEYYIHFVDLLTAKYDELAKKKKLLTSALNAIEIKKVLLAHDAAIPADNRLVLASGETSFTYPHLIKMKNLINEYGDKFVLIAGANIEEDITLWDYNENKYRSLRDALKDLGVEIIKVTGKVTVDGTEKVLLDPDKAILVALNTEAGKPGLLCRRKLNPIQILGGEIDRQLQRVAIVSPAVMPVGANRVPAVGITGFESVAIVVRNAKAIAGFYRGETWKPEA